MSTAGILEKISVLPDEDRSRVAHLLAVPSESPRCVDKATLMSLADCWSKDEADRIERFIEECCENVDASDE